MKIINVHGHVRENQEPEERVAHYDYPGLVKLCLIGREKARLAIERFPDLVIGLGIVYPGEDKPDIIDMYRDQGFKGAKFIAPRAPYDVDEYMPFYEKLASSGMVATFHTGYVSGNHDTSSLWMHPMTLDRIARRFPELPIIGYHLGNPWYTDACSMALSHDNVYWDMSGGTVRATPLSYLKHVFGFRTLEAFGPGVSGAQDIRRGAQLHALREVHVRHGQPGDGVHGGLHGRPHDGAGRAAGASRGRSVAKRGAAFRHRGGGRGAGGIARSRPAGGNVWPGRAVNGRGVLC